MLFALDFDSTLAQTDPYVRLAEENGTSEEVSALLDRISRGDVAFEAGLQSVADHLEGLKEDAAEDALADLRVDPVAADLVTSLRAADHHVAIITAAPERAIHSAFAPSELAADSVFANRLPAVDGALTGTLHGRLLHRTKARALDAIAATEGIELEETMAVGSDRRDLPMLQTAGTGIAVDPTSLVERESDYAFSSLERAREWFERENIV